MSDSESNESDWEEVNEADYDLSKFQDEEEEVNVKEYTQTLDIPTEGIQITVEEGSDFRSRGPKKFDVEGYIRRTVNRRKREVQEDLHKTHLLCLLSQGLCLNSHLFKEENLAVGLSVLPSKQSYPPKNLDLNYVENFMKWFKKAFKIMTEDELKDVTESDKWVIRGEAFNDRLMSQIQNRKVQSIEYLVYAFIIILRALGVHVRLIQNFVPNPLKPPSSELLQDPNRKKKTKSTEDVSLVDEEKPHCSASTNSNSKSSTSTSKSSSAKAPKSKKAKLEESEKTSPRKSTAKGVSQSFHVYESNESDSDFDLDKSTLASRKRRRRAKSAEPAASQKKVRKGKSKQIIGKGNKMISSDEEEETGTTPTKSSKKEGKQRQYIDSWAEVYLEEEERWVSVDLVNAKIMCDGDFEVKSTPPLTYVLSFANDNRVKDVTRRYASKWLTGTQKIRVDSKWWQKTLKPFIGRKNRRDKEEDELLDQHLLNQSIPTSVQDIKGHPLFALKRHLLKFEAIYPPEPPPLGFIKNEAVYSRDCVKTLHARELWMRRAKVVRIGEQPYKIVKARPKWDKGTSTVIKDRPLELFGEWQVEDYIPPPAVDGKVPRNEYGNVELFLSKMLPKGTVHLREPGLSRIAKKLDIDCAPALTGFDFHGGWSHPVYDGFVVCEEFKDILLDAWREDHEESVKREEAKRRKRVRDNWRRIIRMVIVKRRLERKYDTFNFNDNPPAKKARKQEVKPTKSKSSKKKEPAAAKASTSGQRVTGKRKRK